MRQIKQSYDQLKEEHQKLQISSSKREQSEATLILRLKEELGQVSKEKDKLLTENEQQQVIIQTLREELEAIRKKLPAESLVPRAGWGQPRIVSILVRYLPPKDITSLAATSHHFREIVLGREGSGVSVAQSVCRVLQRRIQRLRSHIGYFE